MKRASDRSTFTQRKIDRKPLTHRIAVVEGDLVLGPPGRALLRSRTPKGNAIDIAATAGMMAMKRTSDLIPHCHMVPLTGSSVRIHPTPQGVHVEATAEATWQTGVEMEALLGASVALLTLWDIVKTVEKDTKGEYPATSIQNLRVVRKTKFPT
jgi:cyclic pyranopterin phosphate synthase